MSILEAAQQRLKRLADNLAAFHLGTAPLDSISEALALCVAARGIVDMGTNSPDLEVARQRLRRLVDLAVRHLAAVELEAFSDAIAARLPIAADPAELVSGAGDAGRLAFRRAGRRRSDEPIVYTGLRSVGGGLPGDGE